MSNRILEIRKLSKRYKRIQAVESLDLDVNKGEVFGILGPNGSGKTTTLGMILEVVAPDSGSFSWFSGASHVDARQKIGSILETPCFYPYLTAVQNLKIIAHIKKCPETNIEKVLEQVNLLDRKNDKFKTYSLGMKQRLSIAAALISDPPVLILDEPTNGLDPEGIAEVRSLIKEIAQQGKTIIMASHLLDEVQKVCTHFCILRKGKKLHQGKVGDALGEINKVEISSENIEELENCIKNFDGVESIEKHLKTLIITLNSSNLAQKINLFCHENGIILNKLITHQNSLEQEFLKILKEHD